MPLSSRIARAQSSLHSGLARAATPIFCAFLAAQPTPAIAADQEEKRAALHDLAHEMSTCTAFFTLASTVLKGAAHPDDEASIIRRYTVAGKIMFEQATELTKALDLEDDTVVDWSRLALQEMVKEINADPNNSAALMKSKYDEPCKRLLEDPQTRLRELLQRQGGN